MRLTQEECFLYNACGGQSLFPAPFNAMATPPVILSVAGSDCSAGAGLQADLKTGFALGCYPLTAVTCVVNEVPGKVQGIIPMEADFVAAQMRLCLQSFPVVAVKLGMLYSPQIVRAVAGELRGLGIPVVTDPVMIATAGEPLMQQEAVRVYEEDIFPLTTVLTPNRDELESLSGCGSLGTVQALEAAAEKLASRCGCAVLAKGGHVEGADCTDVLARPNGSTLRWSHPRTEGVSTHGTGCTLSSALAAQLAWGLPLEEAVPAALDYVASAIARSHRLGAQFALNHAKL